MIENIEYVEFNKLVDLEEEDPIQTITDVLISHDVLQSFEFKEQGSPCIKNNGLSFSISFKPVKYYEWKLSNLINYKIIYSDNILKLCRPDGVIYSSSGDLKHQALLMAHMVSGNPCEYCVIPTSSVIFRLDKNDYTIPTTQPNFQFNGTFSTNTPFTVTSSGNTMYVSNQLFNFNQDD